MLLIVQHPGFRSCDDCVKWLWDDRPSERKFGGRKMRHGEPMQRPKGNEPPCWNCPKCIGEKERTPAVGRNAELSEKNWRTWRLYEEVQAASGTSTVRLDDLARRNLGIIHGLVSTADRQQRLALLQALAMRG